MTWQQAFGHGARIFGLAFQANSLDVVASASEDETVRVWSRDASGGGGWQQTSCCRGHTSEVLRVAWSPDGRLLASGSADHTVRFWSVSTSTTQHSYTGTELAVLSGHPEEVYAVHFLPDAPHSPALQQQQQQVHHAAAELANSSLNAEPPAPAAENSSSAARLLLTASGESLYLWDLAGGQLLQQSAPLPRLTSSPAFAAALAGYPCQQQQPQHQQQQQPAAGAQSNSNQVQDHFDPNLPNSSTTTSGLDPSSSSSRSSPGPSNHANSSNSKDAVGGSNISEDAGGSGEGGDDSSDGRSESSAEGEAAAPSYIFGVSVCPETHWAAATCSDGILRLWDASRQALTEVAAVQVHAGQMGSTVSWLPQQPLCVSSISKQGQLVLQDVRLLGRPLLQQQLDGPVYDAVWMAPGISTGSSADGSTGSSAGVLQEQQLVVVGRDNCLRVYTLGAAALQQGILAPPRVVCTPSSYSGSLLALATTADRRQLAAAGEAVQADSLRPAQPQQQQQQQQPAQQHQQQQQLSAGGAKRGVGVRRGRRRAGAVGLFTSIAGDTAAPITQQPSAGAAAGPSSQHQPTAGAAGAAGQPTAASSSDMFGEITIAQVPPAVQQSGGHAGAACAAAAGSGVLTRAPVFVWSNQ